MQRFMNGIGLDPKITFAHADMTSPQSILDALVESRPEVVIILPR